MNNDPIEDYVIEMLKKITPEKKILITERFKTFKEMGYDSLDFLDILMELKQKYKKIIPEKDYYRLMTMDGVIQYIRENFSKL